MKIPNRRYPTGKSTLTVSNAQNDREEVARVVNGGIEFGSPAGGASNIQGFWYQGATPSTPDTEFAVTHNLGYIPTGFLTFGTDVAASLYRSGTAWTTTQAYLKCNQANVQATVFIT